MKITILGCASSLGTPAAGGFWGTCDPLEPRNERSRASILIQSEKTNVLIDATYDVRLQLNRVGIKTLDGVVISHAHSDHVNGIDDLRVLAYHTHKIMDVYANKETLDEMDRRWPYLFRATDNGYYTQNYERREISDYGRFSIGDIEIESFDQDHTVCRSLGFRIGDFAYSVDMADLPQKSLDVLKGTEVWVVDGGGYQREHVQTHANIKRVLEWVDLLKPKMTYITVLSTHMDYKTLCDELPPHVRPAYDGLEIDLSGNRR